MQANTACLLGVLVAMAGCAAPSVPPVPVPVAAVVKPAEPAETGTILAIHQVPNEAPRAVQVLFRTARGSAAGVAEYIVRIPDGTTISVVQPAIHGLRRGDRVSILPGAGPPFEPRLQAAGG